MNAPHETEEQELQRVVAHYAEWSRPELEEELDQRGRDFYDDEDDDVLRLRIAQDDTGLEPVVVVVQE